MPGVILPLRAAMQNAQPAIVRLALLPGTIRGRILFAFLVMSIITAALGGYASMGIKRAGVLVAKTFDESLMSINYARAAAADFSEMQAAFARRWSASSPAIKPKLDNEIATLEQTLADDLSIAAERSQSARAARAATKVQQRGQRLERSAPAPARRHPAQCGLGTARSLRNDGLAADRSAHQLHRRRRLHLSAERPPGRDSGDAPRSRRHRWRPADLGTRGVASGAAHHRAGGGCIRGCQAHRRRPVGRRHSARRTG